MSTSSRPSQGALGALLLRFECAAAALRAMAPGGLTAAGVALFEPLELRASVALSVEDDLHLTVAVAMPSLAPHGMLRFVGEAGVLDRQGNMWHATALCAMLRPSAAVLRARLGARPDLLRYAEAGRHVRFGIIVNNLTLMPEPGSEAPPRPKAYLVPEFVTRRLRAENRDLRAQVRDLEANLDSVLTTVCPAPDAEGSASWYHLGQAAGLVTAETRQRPIPELRKTRRVMLALLAAVDARLAAVDARPAGPESGAESAEECGEPAGPESGAESAEECGEPAGECDECAVCLDAPPDTTFRPCGHTCCCGPCAAALRQRACPLCRAQIESAGNSGPPEVSEKAGAGGAAHPLHGPHGSRSPSSAGAPGAGASRASSKESPRAAGAAAPRLSNKS